MKYFLALSLLFLIIESNAQEKGILSGGFQSESQYYNDDSTIGAVAPDQKIASNNYFKLDYKIDNFTFGIRYEAYLPQLLGYQNGLEGTGIVNRFASYKNDVLKIIVGNYYAQFGSGLVLRSYEERQLGIDNSLDGLKVEISPTKWLDITGLYGKTRNYYETGKGIVRGLDGNIHLNKIIDWESLPSIKLGISAVSKFEEYTGPDEYEEIINAYSTRMSIISNKINFDIEYIEKDKDPSLSNSYNNLRKGRALLINSGYFIKGFGINATFRRLENIDYRSERNAGATNLWINYLPAASKQHGYLLPNIYPYAVQSQGEIGGQFNILYTAKKGTKLGGKYGTKLELNFSQFNQLKNKVNPALSLEDFNTKLFEANDSLIYRDFNIEVKKKFSKKTKTTLSFIALEYNKFRIEGVPSENVKSKIAVIEILYKFPKRRSLRVEAQHLWTKEDKKNWAASIIEFNMNSNWSFYAMDQYNYGSEKKPHFYQIGYSYKKDVTRIAMSYGRQRGGLLCVGGVCRNVPSASGLNLSISSTF